MLVFTKLKHLIHSFKTLKIILHHILISSFETVNEEVIIRDSNANNRISKAEYLPV